MFAINLDAIPFELKIRQHWVVWRYERRDGKRTKVPYTPDGRRADVTDSKTWSTCAHCVRVANRFDGIGIVCADGLAGIDLDHCLDANGNLSELAWRVVNEMQTYTEVTPSGRGLRCLCFGKLPVGGRRKDSLGIEMYDGARYFTVTGNRFPNTPATVEQRDAELAQLHRTIFATDTRGDEIVQAKPQLAMHLDDQLIIEKAMRAKNGDTFAPLWNGDTTGNNSNHADADLALCARLAFWTGGDATQIDRLFRQSGAYTISTRQDTVNTMTSTKWRASTV